MPGTVFCPGCGSSLHVPPAYREPSVTCPRCLARVPNPRPGPADEEGPRTDPRTGIVAAADPPLPVAGRPCPGCGHPTEQQWLFCPYCEERLRERRTGPASVEADVNRDAKGTSWLLIVLAVLGAIPVSQLVYGFLAGVVVWKENLFPELTVGAGAALLLLLAAGWLVAYVRAHQAGRDVRVGRVLFSALAIAGGFVALGFAVLAFFFVVCLMSLGGAKF